MPRPQHGGKAKQTGEHARASNARPYNVGCGCATQRKREIYGSFVGAAYMPRAAHKIAPNGALFTVISCYRLGSTERSRPFPTKQPKGRNHPVRFFDSLSEPPLCRGGSLFAFFSCCGCAACGRSGPGRCPATPKGRVFPAFRPRRPARRSE